MAMINHVNRHPVVVIMAGFTNIAGGHVIRGFARGVNTVVASDTVPAVNIGVIKSTCVPTAGIVASIALQCRFNMRRAFAYGDHIIVATGTKTNYFIVVNSNDRLPGIWGVTRFAQIAAIDMINRFALGTDTIVTPLALVSHGGVIHHGRCHKAIGGMTYIAR